MGQQVVQENSPEGGGSTERDSEVEGLKKRGEKKVFVVI